MNKFSDFLPFLISVINYLGRLVKMVSLPMVFVMFASTEDSKKLDYFYLSIGGFLVRFFHEKSFPSQIQHFSKTKQQKFAWLNKNAKLRIFLHNDVKSRYEEL